MSRKDKSDDLRHMLNSFRIAELQTLLGSCGRSRSGRKHELLGRAMSLLKSAESSPMRERVKSKILELYHQRCPQNMPFNNAGGNANNDMPSTHYSQSNKNDLNFRQYMGYSESDNTMLNNRPNYLKSQSNRNITYPHIGMSHNRYYPSEQSVSIHAANVMPVHPDVRFIDLPFYEIIDTLIKPTSLVQRTMTGNQSTDLVCHFTPLQAQTISKSRSYNIKSVIEYGVQVHLRFCLAETSCVQEDLYPPRCKVIVNNKGITLPGQPPPNAQNQEPRKPHRPVNITSFCELSPMKSNQISIQWALSDVGQRYAATIQIVKAVQTETLINRLQQKAERSPEHSIAFIKDKLKPDPDSEIALTSLKVSLCCPIGRTKMSMPCRAFNCKHLQCFDGSLYIQMNERKPSWLCPVCDQKAHYDQLFKDGLFTQIIKRVTDSDEIVFFNDGSWKTLADYQDASKPANQLVAAPTTPSVAPPNKTILDCKTPPPPLIPSITPPPIPSLNSQRRSMDLSSIPPLEMPNLIPNESSRGNASSATDSTELEKEVEVITIDDSDSEDGTMPILPPSISEINAGPSSERWSTSGDSPRQTLHPDLQGLDLYNLLPHEDRIAAAMYLEKTGLMTQLSSGTSQRSPSVIDISDE